MLSRVPNKVDFVKVSVGLFAPRYDEAYNITVASQTTIAAIAESFGVN